MRVDTYLIDGSVLGMCLGTELIPTSQYMYINEVAWECV